MTVLAKICGVTVAEDAALAAQLGADFLGLNFWPRSKRYLELVRAPELAAAARGARGAGRTGSAGATGAAGAVRLVGVFVNAGIDEIEAAHRVVALDVVQLHGDESPAEAAAIGERLGVEVWKAVAAGERAAVARLDEWTAVSAILLDAPSAGRGGSGMTIDPELVLHAQALHPTMRIVLAGGMRPDNVAEAIARVRPWAVDTASGVEAAPGVKDAAKMAAFLAAVRSAS